MTFSVILYPRGVVDEKIFVAPVAAPPRRLIRVPMAQHPACLGPSSTVLVGHIS